MLNQHGEDIHEFLSNDEKGKMIPKYMGKAGEELKYEHDNINKELVSLTDRIDTIKNILDIQQNIAGTEYRLEKVNVEEAFNSALSIMEGSIKKRKVKIVKDIDPDIRVMANRSNLIHILVNLIKNSLEAFDSPGGNNTIILECEPENDKVHVKVIDTGSGIDPAMLDKVFAHGFSTKENGYGFGLHSCANLMTMMNGKIKLESEGQGYGTIATLIFNKIK